MNARTSIGLTSLIFALSLLANSAQAETDSGVAAAAPWSGYWWQHKSGGLVGPLSKYDQVAGAQAGLWEKENHVEQSHPDWFGHCHAWSASSVSEREPQQPRAVGQVVFGVGDQKGLLAACHAQDVSNSYGDRYGDGAGGDDPADLAPDELWRLLQMYVKQRKIPLILDLEAGAEVWNYPVYQYRVDYQAVGDGWCRATMQLVAADNNVVADYVGTHPAVHQYTFRFRFLEGAIVMGSGQWTGASVQDHPDFAWYPYVAVAENPELDFAQVTSIVGFEVGSSRTPPDDRTPVPPDVRPPTPPADVLSPDELLGAVLNKTSHFMLDVFVDRGDGGRYRPGEPIRVSMKSAQTGYLYLFDVDPEGNLYLVFPVGGQPNQLLKDTLYDIPGPGYPQWYFAQGKGQHDLRAVMTARPIQITGFRDLPVAPPLSSGPPAQAVKPRPTKPQKITLPPTVEARLRQRLSEARKADNAAGAAPEKLGAFAQDSCAYFVLGGPAVGPDPGNDKPKQK